MNERFLAAEHIRRRADFEAAYDTGSKAGGRYMTVFKRASGKSVARLGIAASRKIGGAVQRNRAKRVIRELFRHHKPAGGLDVVIVPRRELLDSSFARLEAEYRTLLERPLTAGARRSVRPRTAPRV